jgi:hypothetical protein
LTGLANNSRRKPLIGRVDVEAFKNFDVSGLTLQLFVRIHSIAAQLPPAQQNPFFTDDVFLKIQGSVVHNDDLRDVLPGRGRSAHRSPDRKRAFGAFAVRRLTNAGNGLPGRYLDHQEPFPQRARDRPREPRLHVRRARGAAALERLS